MPTKAKNFVHIDVAYIAGRSVEDVIEEASKGAFGLVAVGRGLHSSTFQLNMSRFRPKIHPRHRLTPLTPPNTP